MVSMEQEDGIDEFVCVTDAMMKELHVGKVGKARLKEALSEKFQEGVDFRATVRRGKKGRPTSVIFVSRKCLEVLRSSAELRESGDVKNEDRRPFLSETTIQEDLAERLGGIREFKCPAGLIDVFCPSQKLIVEVKGFQRWMEGVGQLVSYGKYFPDYRKRLHLFQTPATPGCCLEKVLVAHDVCLSSGIELTFDDSIEIRHPYSLAAPTPTREGHRN